MVGETTIATQRERESQRTENKKKKLEFGILNNSLEIYRTMHK